MTEDESIDDVKRRDEEEKTDRQKLLQSFYHLKLTTLVMTVQRQEQELVGLKASFTRKVYSLLTVNKLKASFCGNKAIIYEDREEFITFTHR